MKIFLNQRISWTTPYSLTLRGYKDYSPLSSLCVTIPTPLGSWGLWEKSRKIEILRVPIYLLPTWQCFCANKNASCQLMFTPRILWGKVRGHYLKQLVMSSIIYYCQAKTWIFQEWKQIFLKRKWHSYSLVNAFIKKHFFVLHVHFKNKVTKLT